MIASDLMFVVPVIVLVLVLAFIFAVLCLRVANQYERAVVFRLGRYNRTAGPGLFFVNVSDMERLYGDEHQHSLALLQSIRYSTNLSKRIGVAGNK